MHFLPQEKQKPVFLTKYASFAFSRDSHCGDDRPTVGK